jgi:hypothetical protein
MPNKQSKGTKPSAKLQLNKQTIKDLKLKGDKAGRLKGGDYNTGSNSEQCSVATGCGSSDCAHKLKG